MNISMLIDLISNEIIRDFLLGYATNVIYDGTKNFLNKFKKEDSFELLFYELIKETFEQFYETYNLEFQEEIVMKAFAESVNKIEDYGENYIITKKIISDTVGHPIEDSALRQWIKIFNTNCSNPKYQWILNKIIIEKIKIHRNSKDMDWMNDYMKNNYCKIQCDLIDEVPSIFNDIVVKLPKECWYYIKTLLWEIIFNAQEHGKAEKCILTITENSITISDNGKQFNPLTMPSQYTTQGGSIALELFKERYPDIELISKYNSNFNNFTIQFKDNVFNVNSMSQIIIPNIHLNNWNIKLKYPKGKFKYYYIDMGEILSDPNEELFITPSASVKLYSNLVRIIKPQTSEDKIFIYYPYIGRYDYEAAFQYMSKILEKLNQDNNIQIVLVDKRDDDNFINDLF